MLAGMTDSAQGFHGYGIQPLEMLLINAARSKGSMPDTCSTKDCKGKVPSELASEGLCILHFTLHVEEECAHMRREFAVGNAGRERQLECFGRLADRGEALVRVATGSSPLSDEVKARILSTLLTLMNCREGIDRAVGRQSATRRFGD